MDKKPKIHVLFTLCTLLNIFLAVTLYTFPTIYTNIARTSIDILVPPLPSRFTVGAYSATKPIQPTLTKVIHGTIPTDLRGVFLRNGPNPQYNPIGNFRRFDGDGAVHAITFSGQTPIYSSIILDTNKAINERKASRSLYLDLGEIVGKRGMFLMLLEAIKLALGVIPRLPTYEDGTANTAFGYFDGHVYATYESNRPFEILMKPTGEICSHGFESFHQTLQSAMTAHPKTDSITGDLHYVTYSTTPEAPPLQYGTIHHKSLMVSKIRTIEMPNGPSMIHDFAITETRGVVLDTPLKFDLPAWFNSENGWPIQFHEHENVKVGIWDKFNNESNIMWIDLNETFQSFHTMSAWDDGDNGVIVTAVKTPNFTMSYDHNTVNDHTHLWQWRLNLNTKSVSWSREIYSKPCEFPVINQRWLGKRHQFGWVAMFGNNGLSIGVAKVDLWKGKMIGEILWKNGHENTETIIAPRVDSVVEDDGFLIALTTATVSKKVPPTGGNISNVEYVSHAVVYDARTMALEPLVVVEIPHYVPHGLHATFIDDQMIDAHYQYAYMYQKK